MRKRSVGMVIAIAVIVAGCGGTTASSGTVGNSGATAFVTDDEGITSVNLDTGQLGKTIAIHECCAKDLAISANGSTAYVLGTSDGVLPVNLKSGQVGTKIVLDPNNPGGQIAIAPDGRTAYVTTMFGNPGFVILPIDLGSAAAGVPIGPPTVEAGTGGIAISPDGRNAWVSITNSRGLVSIDLASGTLGPLLAKSVRGLQDGSPVVLSPNGQTAYMGGIGSIFPISTRNGRVGTPLRFTHLSGTSLTDIAISPNGQTLYMADGSHTIASVNVNSGEEGKPIQLTQSVTSIAIVP